MTAADHFVRRLRRHGIDWMAGLCGHGLDPLFHAAKQAGLRIVDTRNEQTAAYIAEAAGRLSRRPGVCAVSSGVAVANALTGVVNAWFDGAPMLLVSGAAATRTAGLGHFQDLDQVSLARPVVKDSRSIDHAARTVQMLDEALQIATAPQPGPVHLMFPMDVQTTEIAAEQMIRSVPPAASAETDDDPAEIADALAESSRPLIVAGSGVYYAQTGPDLMQFSEACAIPVVTPIWDRGSIDRRLETFMSVIGAATGGPDLLQDADCILLAGCASDYRLGYLQSGARTFRVTRAWRQLLERRRRQHTEWLEEARARNERFRCGIEATAAKQAEAGTHASHIVSAMREVLPDEAAVLVDGGSVGQWFHQLFRDRYPGHWLTCGRSGVVGWGLGGAMAARLVFPDRPVVLLSGDGAFTFTVTEIECAVRQNLPFVAVVADDQAWGITQTGHVRQFGEPISSGLGPIAFDRLAGSLGAQGVVASHPEDIAPALKKALQQRAVTVIHVPIVGGLPSA